MKRYLASLALCAQFTTAAAADYPAMLDWSQRAVLSTPVSGVIGSVATAAGERVAAGQLLLQLDQRPLRWNMPGRSSANTGCCVTKPGANWNAPANCTNAR